MISRGLNEGTGIEADEDKDRVLSSLNLSLDPLLQKGRRKVWPKIVFSSLPCCEGAKIVRSEAWNVNGVDGGCVVYLNWTSLVSVKSFRPLLLWWGRKCFAYRGSML